RGDDAVVVAVAVLDDDVAGGIAGDGAAAAGEVAHEDVFLHGDMFDAVDVDVLVAVSMVVEQVAADLDVAGAVVDLQDVVVVAVVEDIVDDADAFGAGVGDLHDERAGAGAGVRDVKALQRDALAPV